MMVFASFSQDPDVPKDPERVRAFAHKAGALVRTVDFSMPIENCSVATELTTCHSAPGIPIGPRP